MAMVTPNATFMRRIVPAVVIESIVLAVCVLLFVYTGQLLWIILAGVAGVAFAIWILILLNRHRNEWRYVDIRNP